MPTEIQIAVAGSGKTTEIARRIASEKSGIRSASITFTTTGQKEIEDRCRTLVYSQHETMGWFAFLVRHIVQPYFPLLFPDIVPTGLCFIRSTSEISPKRKGWQYYLNNAHQPYSARLGVLAKKLLKASDLAPIRRLERIYDNIYIDEVQDLGGNDLEILEALMNSSINIFMTGDVRQSVLKTSKSDRLNRKYDGAKQLEWFREKKNEGLCDLTYSQNSHRYNRSIAQFADLIHDPALCLPPTQALYYGTTDHDGVFLVDQQDLDKYLHAWSPQPTILIYSHAKNLILPDGEVYTFGSSKGLTRERIVVIATDPIRKWLKARTLLADSSACGFYVAATRARSSIALVVKNAPSVYKNLHDDFSSMVVLWSPVLEE